MTVLGIFLKGNNAHIATLSGTRSNHEWLAPEVGKLSLEKNPEQKDVCAMTDTLSKHIQQHGITEIVLNRRVTAGQMAGAAGTFIWEGILLATSPVPLTFVHAATLRSTEKKFGELKTKKPAEENEPLGKAYDFAFEGLK